MTAKNTTAAIQVALIEHSIMLLDGMNNVRIYCRCGWRDVVVSRNEAVAVSATHQAEHIDSALNAFYGTIVDAEIVE